MLFSNNFFITLQDFNNKEIFCMSTYLKLFTITLMITNLNYGAQQRPQTPPLDWGTWSENRICDCAHNCCDCTLDCIIATRNKWRQYQEKRTIIKNRVSEILNRLKKDKMK